MADFHRFLSMAQLVAWSMVCKALSRPEIKSNQAWLFTYSYRTKLGICPDKQVSKLGDLDTVFRLDFFLLLLFLFSAYRIQIYLSERLELGSRKQFLGLVKFLSLCT